MEEKNQQSVVLQLREYVETYVKLQKLKAVDKGTSVVASVVLDVVVVLSLLIVWLFASIALAFFLATLLHSYWAGFACVTGFYLLIAVIIMVFKKSFEQPIVTALIKKLL